MTSSEDSLIGCRCHAALPLLLSSGKLRGFRSRGGYNLKAGRVPYLVRRTVGLLFKRQVTQGSFCFLTETCRCLSTSQSTGFLR